MSRTNGRHACGRACIVCRYTPAHNLRADAALAVFNEHEEAEDYWSNVVIERDGRSHLDYAYHDGDWCRIGCRCDDCLETMQSIDAANDNRLRVSLLEVARVG